MVKVSMIIADKASRKTIIRASFFQNKRDENKKKLSVFPGGKRELSWLMDYSAQVGRLGKNLGEVYCDQVAIADTWHNLFKIRLSMLLLPKWVKQLCLRNSKQRSSSQGLFLPCSFPSTSPKG